MKNVICLLATGIIVVSFFYSCGNATTAINTSKDSLSNQKIDTIVVETNKVIVKDCVKSVVAKFLNVKMNDIEAELIFVKEDGSKIYFYQNTMVPDEYGLKFNFVENEKVLKGSSFSISYIIKPDGRVDAKTGNAIPSNEIISVEKK